MQPAKSAYRGQPLLPADGGCCRPPAPNACAAAGLESTGDSVR